MATRKDELGEMRRAWATSRGRLAAFAGCLVPLVIYYEVSADLWRAGNVWWDVAWLAFVLIPAVFGLVLLALPLRTMPWVGPVGLGFVIATVILEILSWKVPANFTRLAAATLLAWWFLQFFETLAWVVMVAAIIPWVDAYSVWRGPTKEIVNHHADIFNAFSFAFPIPGVHAAANLGVPDLLFFALFLGAADRFGLRVHWTWLCLVAALGGTIALTVWFNLNGLPALPGISLGFLVPNADLVWRRLRGQPGIGDRTNVPVG